MGAFRTVMTFLTGAAGGAGAMFYFLRQQQPTGAPPPYGPPASVPPTAGLTGNSMRSGGATLPSTPPPTRMGMSGIPLTTPAEEDGAQRLQDLQAQLAGQEQLIQSLRHDLDTAQGWQSRVPTLARFGQSLAKLPSFKAAAADAAIAATYMPAVTPDCNDLAAVHGIGMAYEQRLYAAGVGTFWELAHLADEDFERMLRPTPLQRTTLDMEGIRADAQRLAAAANGIGLLWSGDTPDDFEPIKGIGDVFEQRLYDAGIRTYRALAKATVEELAVICHSTTMPVQPDYASWIAQAHALAM